ncbi:hypothetical protein [Nocardioides sp.]|uniref:hypothetical protein n=1 Tax=Nocardioides sp. TaxID=35761 RepID=UPI002BE80814|nr:hypothetical protein [Nocardioides sp.]HXH77598.1 hypothetical protein [Nocardioides sp.]
MRALRLAAAAILVATLALIGSTTAQGVQAPAEDTAAYSQTKTLNRTFVVDGQELVVDQRDVTVTVDRTTELRGRERINISWSGAHPTGGRAPSPYGELGLNQEYPVVILQCRGLDDPSLPPEQQLAPSTCWTSTRQQRSQLVDETQAVWRHDVHGNDFDRAQKSGLTPIPPECADVETLSTHVTAFVAANGTVYPSCTAETMAPEAAVGAAFPPAEIAAFTDADGNGATKFEVRSAVENESLGCSDTVRCSVVVIPIQGISCLDSDRECMKSGRFLPGEGNYNNAGVDASVSPSLWWAPSNWRNRFSVPLDFGLPPDACDVLDSRPPTGFYGSELMAQASLQWSPAYCLDKSRFKFQHNKMSDDAGFNLMESGGGVAAFVSSEHEPKGTEPVGYAPVAVTGFSIGYIIDRPDNAGEFSDLRLNARLLAKLLTQSYLGSERARSHQGMGSNPISFNLDPEFQQLNPGLDTVGREAAATVLSLSESSDVMQTLTSYIANDKQAMEWINGKPDQWGMAVNPTYKKIELPVPLWPLLDDFVAPSEQECYVQNPAPYFTQIAAPVTSLRKIAEAVLDAWPNVQTKCERAVVTDPWKIGRVDRQGVGSRMMLGIVSTADARRFGLREASLETSQGSFAAPTDAAMTKALALAEPSKSGDGPFTLDIKDVVKAGNAYPGTMIVYTAALTHGLAKADAVKVADFIDIATTEGQRAGFGNGELPPGYLALARTGPTAPLFKQAKAVAEVIGAQSGTPLGGTDEDGAGETPASGVDEGGVSAPGGSPSGPGSVTEVSPPAPEAGAEPDPKGAGKPPEEKPAKAPKPEPVAMPDTELTSSAVAGQLIPVLLGIALLAALATSLLRLGLSRRRPL